MPNEGQGAGSRRGAGRTGGAAGRGRGGAPRGGDGAGRSGGRGGGAGGRSGGARSTGKGASVDGPPPFSRARGDDSRFAGRSAGGRERAKDPQIRSQEQARYDGPPLDDGITGKELDRSVAQHLRGLPDKLAVRVARHLVAAGKLIDSDPATAYQHTLAARARAARIAVVREACGEAAYAAGEYAEALAELRAAKRMNGSQAYLAVMADCERALGRPERALALVRHPAVADLEPALKAEVTIVEAGARRDLGEVQAALRTLESAPLRSQSRAEWVARLRYAYADTLLAAGRSTEAAEWFHRTVAVDADEITDAAERAAALERSDVARPPLDEGGSGAP